MRLCILFIFVFTFTLTAKTLAQQEKVNLDLKDVSINTLLREIQKQTSFNFVFSIDQTRDLGKFTVKAENETLESVLKRIFAGTGLTYEFSNDLILIRREKDSRPNERKQKEIRIVGKVVDETKTVLPGVTVQLKGMKLGTATDKDGCYALNFPDMGKTVVLVFSFIGMETVEVKYTGKDTINVVMKEDKVLLEDVVITGYANISRQSFTGNVKTISAAELKRVSPTNVLKSLQVLDPSFRITVNNDMGSNPNVLPEINIRGASGIGLTELDAASVSKTALQNDPNLPTFIMDGFEVSVSKVYDLDINRIESITLLKDAAATAIYGSRAANGVVVITTVAPKTGEILITYNYGLDVQLPDLRDYNLMNAREKLEAERVAGMYDGYSHLERVYQQKLRKIEEGTETDWLGKPLRNTASSRHTIRLEGGNPNGLRYALDANYQANNGVMKGSSRKTSGIGVELQYNYKKIRFTNMSQYTGMKSEESPYGSFAQYTVMNPYYSYLGEDGNILKTIESIEGNRKANPLWDANLGSYNESEYKEFLNNFSLQYFFSHTLNLRANIALAHKINTSENFTSPDASKYDVAGSSYKGELVLGDGQVTTMDGNVNLYYNNLIGHHNINLVAGINWKESKDKDKTTSLRDLPRGTFTNPQFARELSGPIISSGQKTRLFGAMLSMNYTYNNIYLADFTGRLDGNSAFGSESRTAPFWSLGLGMNIHNYSFMKSVKWLSELKIRGSYGITGKANFPARTARTVYTMRNDFVYPTGVGVDMAAMGNRNLKWEKTKITDVGGNVSLFDGRIDVTYAYYERRTVDLIADMYIPASSGFVSYKENVGQILNKGHEVSLRLKVLNKNDFQCYVSGNLATNKNRIVKVSDALKSYNQQIEDNYQKLLDDKEHGYYVEEEISMKPLIKFTEGASTSSIYAMQSLGIDPQTGQEMFRYRNGAIATKWLASENVVCGNSEPKLNGTLSANLYFKGITLDIYFTYTYGGQQYNETLQGKIENVDLKGNVDKRVFSERWKEPGDRAKFKSIKDWEKPTYATSRFVQDDNTLSLQSLSLGYELPRELLRKMFLRQMRFSFNTSDVFRVSTIKRERGTSYPFARSFNFSINVGF
ncbi:MULTISPECIES: SusC/RagA family TonB-linked outer membrane protein [Butyricimonas]|uniref:SusC/RagA family TonB-linked outer membrane protein n=1 Tax=Butyricimonas TaxID=574697 RepID=UPI001D091ACD|nr:MULTISPECIES: SusC/RagA family TonB-linked outer membrane protein [Butyricimonas]MCB6974336.1 SusC/RagA family TonB-linked outer membrane protein [Butyricimonas synergistica]MCG4521104.1 SusC/RagA family TonB-linked outer membrane protein [Butyricimonas sp. DFI.6.44]